MPLKLSLKPGEKFAVNGAVLVNGDRRGTLIVQNHASILRERDILQADAVTSPAKHVYFVVMMMYLDEAGIEQYYRDFTARMTEFMDAVSRPEVLLLCVEISNEVMGHRYYAALRHCSRLIEYEQEILGYGSGCISANA